MTSTDKKPARKAGSARTTAKRGTPAAIEMRKPKVHLDAIDKMNCEDRARMIGLGQLIWGDRWRTEMTRALGGQLGRKISPAQMAHWISGTRPLPDKVVAVLSRVARSMVNTMQSRVDMVANNDWYFAVECDDGSVVVPARRERRVFNEAPDGRTRVITGNHFEDTWIDLKAKPATGDGDA